MTRDRSAAVLKLLRPSVQALPLYDPGADPEQVAQHCAGQPLLKLSNNENPLGVAPAALAVLRDYRPELLGLYPDPACLALRHALGERLDTHPSQLIIGNGSENLLELLCLAFLDPGDRVVTQSPCFGLHEIFPLMMAAQVTKVAPHPDFSCNLGAWRSALAGPSKMLLISNPSNPLGTIFDQQALAQLIGAAASDTLLVIDEAYYEYACADPDFPEVLGLLRAQHRPWIVLRTFSKAYGLAGLRVGYGIASDASLVAALDRVRTPYNINQLAQQAALAALGDPQHVARSRAFAAQVRAPMIEALGAAGFRVAPSRTHFLFIDTGVDAQEVNRRLLAQAMIIKAWREPGYETCIRMTLAQPDDNARVLAGLQQAVQALR